MCFYVFYCHSLSATSGFGLARKVRCWSNTKVSSSNIFENDLKREIENIIVMICEAARLKPIRNRIFDIWHPVRVDGKFAKYTVLWCSLSLFVLCKYLGMSYTLRRG